MQIMKKKGKITRIPTSEIQKKLEDPDSLPPRERVELNRILKQREREEREKEKKKE